jgi:hypothetical protein
MRIVTAFICNHAEVQSSMLYVHGGFPEWWNITEIPSRQNLGLAMVAEIEEDELDIEFDLTVTAERDQDQSLVGAGGIRFQRPPSDQLVAGAPLYQPLAMGLLLNFQNVGPHRVLISESDQQLAEVRFGVRVS